MQVSLYIPVHNGAEYIRYSLDSAFSQTVSFCEVIVVNDGSADNILEIIKDYPVKIINKERREGLAAARNSAVKAALFPYVASIDADVVLNRGWLERLLEYILPEDVGGVCGKLVEDEKDVYSVWRKRYMPQNFGDNFKEARFLPGCNTLFKKSILEEAGLYDERYQLNHEDTDISARICKKGYKLLYVPSACAVHIKRDNIYTLMRSCWGFRHKDEVSDIKAFFLDIFLNAKQSLSLFLQMFLRGEFYFLKINTAYFFMQLYFTAVSFKRRSKKGGSIYR